MKYQFYAIIFDVAGNVTPVGSSGTPAKSFVTNIQKVTGININPSGSVTKNIGENFTISVTVSPSDANNKTINWNSSNKSVATVNSNGKVTCLAAGTTSITATATDGSSVSASLSLTVRNPLNSLTLDKDQTTIMKDGFVATVTATTDPANYADSNISWSIADTSIATLTVSGKTASIKSTSKIGQTTLTVSAGGITKTVKISVVNFVTQTYSYTGSVQQVELPAGTYKLEVWGAQGGTGYYGNINRIGGSGGYSVGLITLTSPVKLYIYVGGQGLSVQSSSKVDGGFNGGGYNEDTRNDFKKGTGGGGTDIRIDSNSLYSRVIVAGGGGGGNAAGSGGPANGGAGGGLTGCIGAKRSDTSYNPSIATAGTIFAGGQSGSHTGGGDISNNSISKGSFGIGGSIPAVNNAMSGAGGGGWYGGGAGNGHGGPGAGGSGWVYTETNYNTWKSGNSIDANKYLLNSSYYLTNAQTIAGNQSFPNVAGTSNETGHSGNGAAKITPVN